MTRSFVGHVAGNVAIVVCSLLSVAVLVGAGYVGWVPVYAAMHPPPPLAISSVKMEAPNWTGSGVYLGNGYIITAGHVTDGLISINIELSDGTKTKGTVLWTNTPEVGGYDVSLVYAPNLHARASHLDCAPTHVGEAVSIIGNPGPLMFLKTWGRVSGSIGDLQWGPWHSLVALDITSAPGVSGAPVFNTDNAVVGILVSGLVMPRGSYAYSMMVPSLTICELLAR